MEIDASKDVYLFVHGRSDLVEKSTAALVAKGIHSSFVSHIDHPKHCQSFVAVPG